MGIEYPYFFLAVYSVVYFLFHYRQVFCDFGEKFVITDPNGETPISDMVAEIGKVGVQ